MKIAIIKADDIKAKTDHWAQFFQLNQEKGIKVSAGIITDSLASGERGEYQAWLVELAKSGWVEFWNHGWDHRRWTDKSETLFEFCGSGYDHQKKHFHDAQAIMTKLFNQEIITFGAPYNKIDADTVQVLNENDDTRLVFSYGTPTGLDNKLVAHMKLRGEHDGTGQPNYHAFIEDYQKQNLDFSALQFHPDCFEEKHFAEYSKIIDLLIEDNWTFMLPSEYCDHLASTSR